MFNAVFLIKDLIHFLSFFIHNCRIWIWMVCYKLIGIWFLRRSLSEQAFYMCCKQCKVPYLQWNWSMDKTRWKVGQSWPNLTWSETMQDQAMYKISPQHHYPSQKKNQENWKWRTDRRTEENFSTSHFKKDFIHSFILINSKLLILMAQRFFSWIFGLPNILAI